MNNDCKTCLWSMGNGEFCKRFQTDSDGIGVISTAEARKTGTWWKLWLDGGRCGANGNFHDSIEQCEPINCKECGNESKGLIVPTAAGTSYMITCTECHNRTPECTTEGEALRRWNNDNQSD